MIGDHALETGKKTKCAGIETKKRERMEMEIAEKFANFDCCTQNLQDVTRECHRTY